MQSRCYARVGFHHHLRPVQFHLQPPQLFQVHLDCLRCKFPIEPFFTTSITTELTSSGRLHSFRFLTICVNKGWFHCSTDARTLTKLRRLFAMHALISNIHGKVFKIVSNKDSHHLHGTAKRHVFKIFKPSPS